MTRPLALVVVLGTATDVGKTWVTVELLGRLRARGDRVAVRKPAQSYAADEAGATDADLLAAASGEAPTAVCPPHRWYPTPMAPPMAADALGLPRVALDDLLSELQWPDPTVDVGVVEAAGGPCSPMAHDGDGVDLTLRLRPDHVVVVADAGLGTISAVRVTVASLRHRGAGPTLVHLNRFEPSDDLHRRNRDWLVADGHDLCTEVDHLVHRLAPR